MTDFDEDVNYRDGDIRRLTAAVLRLEGALRDAREQVVTLTNRVRDLEDEVRYLRDDNPRIGG